MAARRKKSVVVPFMGSMPAHGVSHPEVVAFFEYLLAEARSGAITGAAASWIGPAQSVNTDWTSGMADRHDMMAGVSMLQFKMIRACVDG